MQGVTRSILITLSVVLLLLPSTIVAADSSEAIYYLEIDIATDSDWSTIVFSTMGDIKILDQTIIEGESVANIVLYEGQREFSLCIGKLSLDQSPVQVRLQLMYSATDPELGIVVEKGAIGETEIDLYTVDGESRSIVWSRTHGRVISNLSTNRVSYRVETSNLLECKVSLKLDSVDPERRVLAFYYPWYGNVEYSGGYFHWSDVSFDDINGSSHYPVLGAYDSLDPELVDAHMEMAKQASIDTLVCSWMGAGGRADKAISLILEKALENGLSGSILYESLRLDEQPITDMDVVVDELVYIIDEYGDHPAFLKLNGVPVIFIYQADTQGRDPDFWSEIIERVEDQQGNVVFIGQFGDSAYWSLFDGVYNYIELDVGGFEQRLQYYLDEEYQLDVDSWEQGLDYINDFGYIPVKNKLVVGTVSPGYDDSEIRSPSQFLSRNDLDTYRDYWSVIQAKDPDWVVISTFNEWHEGTEIEPSREQGFKYLVETRRQSSSFKDIDYVEPALPDVSVDAVYEDSILVIDVVNYGEGGAYAVNVEVPELGYDLVLPVLRGERTLEVPVEVGLVDSLVNIWVSYLDFLGNSGGCSTSVLLVGVVEPNEVEDEGNSDELGSIFDGVDLVFDEFSVMQENNRVLVTASAWVYADPAEVDYCSLDVLVNGSIVYGECWSYLPGLGHAGVNAPYRMYYQKYFDLPEGKGYVQLRGYARNVVGFCVKETEKHEVVGVGEFVEVDFSELSFRKVGVNLVIDVGVLISSYPVDIEYASIDVLVDDVIVYGECWTDLDVGSCNPGVSAPVTVGYSMGLENPGEGHVLKVRTYVRNEAGVYIVAEQIVMNSVPKQDTVEDVHDFVLGLINKDRQDYGVEPLVLSTESIAQSFADEMLSTGVFEHNTELGSEMGENIAMMRFYSYSYSVEEALTELEHSMMYEDEASNWGHRDNILNPGYGEVSIGVACDEEYIYLVQDFIR